MSALFPSLLRLFLTALVLLGGCAGLAPPDRASRVLRPAVDTMPYVVTVHYPAQFRNATQITPARSGLDRFTQRVTRSPNVWNYPYGANSVALLDAAFGGMFEKVIRSDDWPDGLTRTSDARGTLVAESVAINLRPLTPLGRPVTVTYIVSLYGPSGTRANSWQVSSQERLADEPQLGATIHAAMTEAVAKLASIILDERHKFKEWLAPVGAR